MQFTIVVIKVLFNVWYFNNLIEDSENFLEIMSLFQVILCLEVYCACCLCLWFENLRCL